MLRQRIADEGRKVTYKIYQYRSWGMRDTFTFACRSFMDGQPWRLTCAERGLFRVSLFSSASLV